MVSNYTVSKNHNVGGDGTSLVWYTLEICDISKEELEKIMNVVRPMYIRALELEGARCALFELEQKKNKDKK